MSYNKNKRIGCEGKRIIFVLGGMRSGKSNFALEYSERFEGDRIFIATAEPLDPEMKRRIERHRTTRSEEWKTIEEPIRIYDILKDLTQGKGVVVIDCLTLWLSNMLRDYDNEELIVQEIDRLCGIISETRLNIVMVSNEVGLGIIPVNMVARRFCNLSGIMNKKVVEIADEVYMIFSGISMKIK